MARSRFAWGIDIGNRALKAVKLVRDGGGVRIDDFDVIEHEHILSSAGDNRESLIQTALAIFSGKHATKGGSVAIGVSGQQSFARFIKLPPVEDRKIPEIVKFEAIQQIPFPLDEVEWSYQLFRNEGSPDVEVGIFAMRKDLVQQHIKYFSDTGMNVQVVQMNPLAVYNGLYHDRRLEGTTMIIDLGAENADLIITEGEQIWMRSIPIGGNNFTEALTKAFKLRFEKAEEMKRNAATSKYGRQILQAMRPIFADLVAEIQRSIGFYSSVHRDSRIQRVLALGGTFRLPGLQKYLQQNLSLDVVKIDQLGDTPPRDSKVATSLNEDILSAVSAYGLALQAMDDAKITSSLLPQAIRQEREWKAKTPIFAAAAALFVGGAALPIARLYSEQYKFQQAKPIQNAIQADYVKGKGLSDQWAKISSAGDADRKRAADVMTLLKYRDVWPALYQEICDCVPPAPPAKPPAKPAAGAAPAAAPDTRIFLDDIQEYYNANLGPLLGLDETGLNAALGPNPPPSRGGVIPGHTAVTTTDTGTLPGNAAADAAAGQVAVRGYVITIHALTPNPNGVRLVDSTFVERLRNRIKTGDDLIKKLTDEAANPKPGVKLQWPSYQIKRASLPSSIQFFKDPERMRLLQERYKEALTRKAASGLNFLFTPPAPGAGAPGAPAAPVGPTVPPTVEIRPDDTNYLLNPITGENMREWWDVTVRLVVVLDPGQAPKQQAPAPPKDE